MRLQIGTGWDSGKGVIVMDNEWWRKTKKVSSYDFKRHLCVLHILSML
jgi:hypothetical protein